MASLSEEEVVLEARADIAAPTGQMSWSAYKETLREKFKAFLISHCWPEREFEMNEIGEYRIPSVERMYQGYVIAWHEIWTKQLGVKPHGD